MKHERDLNLNHTLLLWILRRKYWGRSFLYYSWIVHAERLRRRLFGKLEEAVYQRLAELATQAREWDFICSSSFHLRAYYFTFLPTACHPGARVGFHQLSYTRVILCFSQNAWRKDARVRFHLLIIFSTRRVLFCIFADSLSPRRASEISSTLHRLLCVSLLRIVAQVVATKTREWDSIYVSSALLPACTQYSRPELATQGITVVALVTDFEVTCAYPMPDEWRNLIANQHNEPVDSSIWFVILPSSWNTFSGTLLKGIWIYMKTTR